MEIDEYVKKHINYLCKKKQITHYQIWIETGISQSTLSKISRGEQIPTLVTLDKICKVFGITLAEFFMTSDSRKNLKDDERTALQFWEDLSEKEKRIIRGVLSVLRESENNEE